MTKNSTISILITFGLLMSCQNSVKKEISRPEADSQVSCMKVPSRFSNAGEQDSIPVSDIGTEGMILIQGGVFDMGGDNNQADEDEYPKRNCQGILLLTLRK